jgi:hypothetical protein
VRWITAIVIGVILGFALPLIFGGPDGIWLNSWAGRGTIHPLAGSPGLLFSIPFAVGAAICLRLLFNWHSR